MNRIKTGLSFDFGSKFILFELIFRSKDIIQQFLNLMKLSRPWWRSADNRCVWVNWEEECPPRSLGVLCKRR